MGPYGRSESVQWFLQAMPRGPGRELAHRALGKHFQPTGLEVSVPLDNHRHTRDCRNHGNRSPFPEGHKCLELDASTWEQSSLCPGPVTCHLAFPLQSSEAPCEDHGRCSREAGPSRLRDTEAAAPLSAWKILGQALQGALCSLCWGRNSSLRSYRRHQGTIHPETASQNRPREDGHSLAQGPCGLLCPEQTEALRTWGSPAPSFASSAMEFTELAAMLFSAGEAGLARRPVVPKLPCGLATLPLDPAAADSAGSAQPLS